MVQIEAHPFMPGNPSEMNDVNVCSWSGCGQSWNNFVHQPDKYLSALTQEATEAVRKVAESAGVPEGLVAIERASGPPSEPFEMPADGYLPRGFAALHGIDPANVVPAKPLEVDGTTPYRCPHAPECDYAASRPDPLSRHLRQQHRWNDEAIKTNLAGTALRLADAQNARDVADAQAPLKHNGVTTELHRCSDGMAHERHLWQPNPGTEWFTCLGLPWASIDCPICGNAYLRDRILLHMRDEEAVDQSELDEMSKAHELNPLLTYGEIQETMAFTDTAAEQARTYGPKKSLRDALQRAVHPFMNPRISHEEALLSTSGLTEGELMNAMDELAPNYLGELLADWWMSKAEDEVRRTVPKAVEYGATDLSDIGHDLAKCMGREVNDEEAAELGVFFYIRGKMSRWVDAVKRGDRVSDDTLFDIGVYVRMTQRIRDAGGWPGLPMPKK